MCELLNTIDSARWLEESALIQIAVFFLVWILLWLPIAIPLAVVLKWQPTKPITPTQKLPLLMTLYGIAPLVLWGLLTIQDQSFSVYGLPWKPHVLVSFGLGWLGGVVGLALMFALMGILGWVRWQAAKQSAFLTFPELISLLSILLLGIGVGLIEELIFRGFLIYQLRSTLSLGGAAGIASLVFAVLHLVWEGQQNIPQLPGLWLMGMVLALACWVDGGELGLAWGLHAGWIWTIASLDTTQRLTYTHRVPTWITGVGNHPLAGVMGLLFLGITAGVLWALEIGFLFLYPLHD